ncbi:MAG: Tn3 family transposase [bacterium]|nr:Tn3 family transposase [bacterium]
MASIERTAYPRFKKVVSDRELVDAFTPTADEISWAAEATRNEGSLLTLVVLLKAFQRLGYFPTLSDVPSAVVAHVGHSIDVVGDELEIPVTPARTIERYRVLIRSLVGVVYDPEAVRKLIEDTIWVTAQTKDNPADLINVALEELVKARYELPGYSTLDRTAGRIRAEVNHEFFLQIGQRVDPASRALLLGMLDVDPSARRSRFDELKRPARRPSLSRLKEHTQHLKMLDATGGTEIWLAEVPPAKTVHFAAEARVLDASDLRKVGESKRLALLVCLLHQARIRARDDLAEMLCRRMATIHKRGRDDLAEIRERQRTEIERLWGVFGRVLAAAQQATRRDDADDPVQTSDLDASTLRRAGALMLQPLADAGGLTKLSVEHAGISAHHGNNYMPLLARRFRSHRKALFDLAEVLDFESTSADHSVLAALDFIQNHRHHTRRYVDDHHNGEQLDTSFCSQNWIKAIRDRDRPGELARIHLEVCVFSYLAAELRSGDIAVKGADSYANFVDQLLSSVEVEPLIAGYCAEVGLPATPDGFRAQIEHQLERTAALVDAGYRDNADLTIDDAGHPTLKRRRGKETPGTADALAKAVEDRMHEVSLLDITTRTAHWIGWHRHFGPLSGSDPKLSDPLGRYAVVTFTYGTNMGPYQMSRHLRGAVSPHEISAPGNQHVTPDKLNLASADVVDAYMSLDVAKLWGDGSKVGADGTQIDTWDDNLLAETSIRYGGYGGIAYRHIADTYIALFSHFIPCGVWEAVFIFAGLLEHASETIDPEEIHTDTQGQSLPAFGLTAMLGVELLPRIRNWKDLIFYRPSADTRYQHIDSLFGEGDVIDWKLIETHWIDLMRVVISIRQGRISSSALLRRLGNQSRKNRIYKAFRELGRAIRTIVLLRYVSETELRESITAVTNRVESFHNFSKWLSFGNVGVIADNDPDHMEKIIKFNELLANCVIFYNAAQLTDVLNQLAAEDHPASRQDVAALSPYTTKHVLRFGDYVLDLTPPTTTINTHLELDTTENPAETATPRK